MKKAGKSIALILAILIVFTLYNSLYTVQPKQYVAVRQFGRIVNVVDSPGLKMKRGQPGPQDEAPLRPDHPAHLRRDDSL